VAWALITGDLTPRAAESGSYQSEKMAKEVIGQTIYNGLGIATYEKINN
jgi:hypothetical protein